MKLSLVTFLLVILGCNVHKDSLQPIKEDMLFRDSQGIIYLKKEVFLLHDTRSEPKIRYHHLVGYKGKILELTELVDVETFTSENVSNIYTDKKYRYVFDGRPGRFPSIQASDK